MRPKLIIVAFIFLILIGCKNKSSSNNMQNSFSNDESFALLCKVKKYEVLDVNYIITISKGSVLYQSNPEDDGVERKDFSFKISDELLQINFIENFYLGIDKKNRELYRTETHKVVVNRFSGQYFDEQINHFDKSTSETGPFKYQGVCTRLEKKF